MAIVEMKRMMLLALDTDREKLFNAMQRMGCIEITPLSDEEKGAYLSKKAPNDSITTQSIERLSWAIKKLGKFNQIKAPMFGKRPEVDAAQEQEILSQKASLMQLVSEAEALERENGEIAGKKARLQAAIAQISPWLELDIPLNKVTDSKDTFQLMGQVPKAAIEQLHTAWAGRPVCLNSFAVSGDSAYIWAVGHKEVKNAFLSDIKAAGFIPTQFDGINATARAQYERYQAELNACDIQERSVIDAYAALAKNLPQMHVLFDVLSMEKDRLHSYSQTVGTEKTFILKGWAPAALAPKIEAGLHKISPTCAVEIYAPPEGDDPPTALHNSRGAAPFETIVSGFSLPSPYGIDPTAVMAPFFACLFGMMVSDAGYGIIMALGIPLFIKLYKPAKSSQKLMWVLAIGGWFTVLWGAVYNTWFGAQMNYRLVDPLKDSLTVMVISIAFGALHLFTGLGMAAYMNIKRKKPLDAVYDQLSWFLVLVGLGLMLIVPAMATVGQYVALAGVGIILFTAGRDKSRNPLKRLMSGLGALYGATGWISDLLSYMRLFGMGLATGVIGMVVNQLVAMVFSAGIPGKVIGIVLFVGAHAFNAGINILGAYVHSCRLQYIEFFGKFYEEGGRPFKPLAVNTRYVNLKETGEI